MAWNPRAPQDRATAQIVIVFGGIVMVIGALMLGSVFASGDAWELSRRGVPVWVLAAFATAFGGWLAWKGIAMWRADKPRDPRA